MQLEDTNANQLCHWAYVGITFGIISQLLEPALKLRHKVLAASHLQNRGGMSHWNWSLNGLKLIRDSVMFTTYFKY